MPRKKTKTIAIVILFLMVTVFSSLPSNTSQFTQEETELGSGTPHALFGFIHAYDGEVISEQVTVTLKNNRTGGVINILSDPIATDYSYRLNDTGSFAQNGDWLELTTSLDTFSAKNWTRVDTSYPNQKCHLELWGEETQLEVPIKAGWNLVSTPFIHKDANLRQVLSDMEGGWDKVQAFHKQEIEQGYWMSYDVSAPGFLNDFQTMESPKGYWLHVEEPGDGNLSFSGLLLKNVDVPLYKGWNLVGYPSMSQESVDLALSGIPYDAVQGFSSQEEYNLRPLSPLDNFEPGNAYWIHVTSSCTWSIYNPGGIDNLQDNAFLTSANSPEAKATTLFQNGTSTASSNQTSPGVVAMGQTDVPMINISFTNNGPVPEMLVNLTVTGNNTDDADVDEVRLSYDASGDGTFGPGDVFLAPGKMLASGQVTFENVNFTIPANSTEQFFLTLNISSNATANNTVDLFVDSLDMVLQNAGANLLALNPSGNVKIVKPLTKPHVIYGRVYDLANALLPNATVTVTNNRTGQELTDVTDGEGRYNVDLSDLNEGYLMTDGLTVHAKDANATVFGINYTGITDSFGDQCNVSLEEGPWLFNETPPNGSVVMDEKANIQIEALDNGSGVDPTSIILFVEGVNYTIDSFNLSYNGTHIFFNATNANRTWTNGQNVNVSLLSCKDIAGNDATPLPYSWNFTVSLGVISLAPEIHLRKQGADINISWENVTNATSYVIYRSNATDGTGFNWSDALAEVGDSFYIDLGVLNDTGNYSYVVKAKTVTGEGPASNIGWKLDYKLIYYGSKRGGALNYLSLPYFTNISSASELINDIGPNCTAVSRWNKTRDPNYGVWDDRIFIPGFGQSGMDFKISPGEGYLVSVNENVTYTIVGSHDPGVSIKLTYMDKRGGALNYLSLPYHLNLSMASDVLTDIGPNCTAVSRWNLVSDPNYGIWEDRIFIPGFGQSGTNFPITPGEAYLVSVNADVTWTPPIPSI